MSWKKRLIFKRKDEILSEYHLDFIFGVEAFLFFVCLDGSVITLSRKRFMAF